LNSQLATLNGQGKRTAIVNIGNSLNPDLKDKHGDFYKFVNIISSNFSNDFFKKDTLKLPLLEMIFKEALNNGWSSDYFFQHLRKFLKKQHYEKFTFADFYSLEIPKLKNHSDYLKLLEKEGESVNHIPRVIFKTKNNYHWIFKDDITRQQIYDLKEKLQCEVMIVGLE